MSTALQGLWLTERETYSCLSFSFSLSLGVFLSATRNLMRLALLAELLRNFLHCWIRWPGVMFRNCIPVVLPLFDLSAFLIESSRYVSKTTSILWLLTPSCRMWVSADSASWANVWSLPFIFWTRLMPSIIVAEGPWMVSAVNTCFSNSLARAALVVFLIVPSPLAPMAMARVGGKGHHSSGDGGSATRTMWANRFLSACRMTLFELLAEVFLRISENVFSLFFVICHGTEPLVFRLQAGIAWIPRMLPCQFCAHQGCPLLHLAGPGYLPKCWQTHFHLCRKGSSIHLPEASQLAERQLHP